MNFLNQNTYRAYVMVSLFIKNKQDVSSQLYWGQRRIYGGARCHAPPLSRPDSIISIE